VDNGWFLHLPELRHHSLAANCSAFFGKCGASEYQGRTTFTGQELEPVLGFRGHTLTDVVKGFDDIRDAVKVVAEMSQTIDSFMVQHRQEMQSMQGNKRLIDRGCQFLCR
jgi:hypothetical protein